MRRMVPWIAGLIAWSLVVPGLDAAIGDSQISPPSEDVSQGTPESTDTQGVPSEALANGAEVSGGQALPAEIREILRKLSARRAEVAKKLGVPTAERSVTSFIVGGNSIDISEAPWQVFLAAGIQYFDDDPDSFAYAFFCGGSIIDARWIVTAAHCVENPSIDPYLYVAAGVSNNEGLTGDDFHKVDKVFVHPGYDYFVDNDIALIQLSESIDLTGVPEAIDLPSEDPSIWPAAKTPGMITGWGATLVDGWYQYPANLQKGNVLVLAGPGNVKCGLYGALDVYFNPETMLCAGLPRGGTDTCFGDSGGPLAIDVGGQKVLAGITSWGSGDCGAPGFPGVYSRVTTYVPWVESITRAPQGVPVITAITGGNRSLMVAVDVSSLTGDDATNFQYSLNNGRWLAVNPPDADGAFMIGNLKNGRSYSVRVRAVNPFGVSDPSEPVSGTPTATMPGPAVIEAVTPGNKSLRVDFTQATSSGATRITGYEYSIDGGVTWKLVRSTKSPIRIGQLSNGVEYTVIIRARTVDGPGEPSAPIVGTPAPPPPKR